MAPPPTYRNAIIGAAVTIVLAITGISPLLGGGVAGYLQGAAPERGARVGALSGVIATGPLVTVLVLGIVAYFGGTSPGIGSPGGLGLGIVLFVLVPIVAVWTVGVGAIGGYLGAFIRSTRGRQKSTEPTHEACR